MLAVLLNEMQWCGSTLLFQLQAPSEECHTPNNSSSDDLVSAQGDVNPLDGFVVTENKSAGLSCSVPRGPSAAVAAVLPFPAASVTQFEASFCRFFPAWCFVLPKALLDIPFAIWQTTLWVCIHYFAVGFSRNAGRQVYRRLAIYVPCQLHSMWSACMLPQPSSGCCSVAGARYIMRALQTLAAQT